MATNTVNLRNKTASVVVYGGKAYGPGRVIPYSEKHAGGRDVVAMLGAGSLEADVTGKGNPSDGLTVEQLKGALTEKKVEFSDTAKKAELAALLDAAG